MTKLKYCAYDNKNFAFDMICFVFQNQPMEYKIFSCRYVAT